LKFDDKVKKQSKKMKTSATAIANYFIDLAIKENAELRQFGLMKRVYITHGFHLAFFDKGVLDPPYDVVEAWANGPVIPSIYHAFKHFGNNPIREKAVLIDVDLDNNELNITTPELKDENTMEVVKAVWDRYREYDDFELIRLLHGKGTPWAMCYRKGVNCIIPDDLTRTFYLTLLESGRKNRNSKQSQRYT
jgi:uncharacterized phage-associated protein